MGSLGDSTLKMANCFGSVASVNASSQETPCSEPLLATVQPSESLFTDSWEHRAAQTQSQTRALCSQRVKTSREVNPFHQRIAETNMPAAMQAYAERIRMMLAQIPGDEKQMAHPTGFEPVTFGIGKRTSSIFLCFLLFTVLRFC